MELGIVRFGIEGMGHKFRPVQISTLACKGLGDSSKFATDVLA
jgi:hypothetical protein